MRFSTGIDQSDTSHITICHLITTEINRVFRCEFRVHAFICLSETNRFETTIIGRKFLLHNVRFDGNSQTVSLSGKVGSSMIINSSFLEIAIAQITPQNGSHTEFMGIFESLSNLYQLAATLFRTEINGCAYCYGSHIPSLFHRTK